MNEYDPKPQHVLPLNYAGPTPRHRQPGAFALGCISSLALLLGLPALFASASPDGSLFMLGLALAAAIILGSVIWSFMRGKRAFARGMIWGPLMAVCVLLLLVGICAMILR